MQGTGLGLQTIFCGAGLAGHRQPVLGIDSGDSVGCILPYWIVGWRKDMHYEIKAKKNLYRGFFELNAYSLEHDRFDGGRQTIERENFERGDAVVVLLYDRGRDKVLLTEQFRIGPAVRGDNAWLIELVAGMIKPGEDPLECARRECIEEAGYEPTALNFIARYYASPGGTSERIFLFMSEVEMDQPVGEGGGLISEHEDIRAFWVAREEALAMVRDGRINSSGPMLALLLAFMNGRSDVPLGR
jgi:ADP-ribose pyrophosphatase